MLYLTADKFPIFLPFGIIGFYRYFWYLIRMLAALVYRPIPPPGNPTYLSYEDVTIIVPTIDAGEEFKEAAFSWLQNNPAHVYIVTEHRMTGPLQALADAVDPTRITVLSVPKANKRLQMVHGIKHVTTDICVFADDDAVWPPTLLEWVLACFEDQGVGGVGTSQRVKPVGHRMSVWETLAAFRLSIRNFEIAASTHIDGGVPCLSGRTAAYRTIILKDPAFLHGFTNDYWLGKYLLNSGDDKFLTRWLVSHGWQTYIQVCPQAELLSTMKPDWRFLKQVLRWTRNTWRSDIRSVFKERQVWTSHPFVAYSMCDKFINPITLLLGPVLVGYMLYKSTKDKKDGGYHLPAWNILVSYAAWVLVTRTAKLLPHLWGRPQDVIYVPHYLLFQYFFAFNKIYALLTLHETGWGTRKGVGEPADANDAIQQQQEQQQQQRHLQHPARQAAHHGSASPGLQGAWEDAKYGGRGGGSHGGQEAEIFESKDPGRLDGGGGGGAGGGLGFGGNPTSSSSSSSPPRPPPPSHLPPPSHPQDPLRPGVGVDEAAASVLSPKLVACDSGANAVGGHAGGGGAHGTFGGGGVRTGPGGGSGVGNGGGWSSNLPKLASVPASPSLPSPGLGGIGSNGGGGAAFSRNDATAPPVSGTAARTMGARERLGVARQREREALQDIDAVATTTTTTGAADHAKEGAFVDLSSSDYLDVVELEPMSHHPPNHHHHHHHQQLVPHHGAGVSLANETTHPAALLPSPLVGGGGGSSTSVGSGATTTAKSRNLLSDDPLASLPAPALPYPGTTTPTAAAHANAPASTTASASGAADADARYDAQGRWI